MPNAFVDTNVLVYAADEVVPVSVNTRVARQLLLQRDLCISVQVLNEFTANARNPKKLNLSEAQEKDWTSRWLQFEIASLTVQTYTNAQEIHRRYQLSHWDALIVAAAQEKGCRTLYSEDLNDGQDYDGVRVVNPFKQP
jgi:predicted nucleic acid-binding protein